MKLKKLLILPFSLILLLIGFSFLQDLRITEEACTTNNCIRADSSYWLDVKKSANKKISKFIKRSEKRKYIEFTNAEFSYLLSNAIVESSDNIIDVDKIVVDENPSTSNSFVYNFHCNILSLPIGWFKVSFTKNNWETVYIYIDKVYWDNINLTIVARGLVNKINYNIKTSTYFINTESSAPFVFDNIEFLDNKVIIKGHYTEDYY